MGEEIFIKEEKPKTEKKKRVLSQAQKDALAKGRKAMAEKRAKEKQELKQFRETQKKDAEVVKENKKQVKQDRKLKLTIEEKEKDNDIRFRELQKQNEKLGNVKSYEFLKSKYMKSMETPYQKKFMEKVFLNYEFNDEGFKEQHLNDYIIKQYGNMMEQEKKNSRPVASQNTNIAKTTNFSTVPPPQPVINKNQYLNHQQDLLQSRNKMIEMEKELLRYRELERKDLEEKEIKQRKLKEKEQQRAIKIHNNYINQDYLSVNPNKIKPKYNINNFNGNVF